MLSATTSPASAVGATDPFVVVGREQQILGLDVAVDEAPLVGVREACRSLRAELDHAVRRQTSGPVELLRQVLSVNVLEDDVRTAVGFAVSENANDVRM